MGAVESYEAAYEGSYAPSGSPLRQVRPGSPLKTTMDGTPGARWDTPMRASPAQTPLKTPSHGGGGAPRLLAEEAVNDLIRYSLVPAVLIPAIVPALESALMQMVPSVLGRAVANQLSSGGLGSSAWRRGGGDGSGTAATGPSL